MPTGSAWHASCTSVTIGTSNVVFAARRIFNPSSIPGPRNDLADVRFALSKLDLNTSGIPTSSVMRLIERHMRKMCSSDWITFGPAIRKNGEADFKEAYKASVPSMTIDDVFRDGGGWVRRAPLGRFESGARASAARCRSGTIRRDARAGCLCATNASLPLQPSRPAASSLRQCLGAKFLRCEISLENASLPEDRCSAHG